MVQDKMWLRKSSIGKELLPSMTNEPLSLSAQKTAREMTFNTMEKQGNLVAWELGVTSERP